MPESNSYWFIASPLDGNPEEMTSELAAKVEGNNEMSVAGVTVPKATGTKLGSIGKVTLPEFKAGTLSSLLALSDVLAKQDPAFTAILGKIIDTIRNLDPNKLEQHLVVDDGRPYEDYLLSDWKWNRAKYRVENRPLDELVESLVREMTALDNIHKQKLSNYNTAKSQLQTLQRKKTGNLQNRDLSNVITKDDVAGGVQDSEYLETLYVAVPKNNIKEWNAKYERLTSMVVPRSSIKLATDEEFALFTVTVFRKVKDEFIQKCREEKFTVREYVYDESAITKQKSEFEELERSERDLWAELMRISRINFSEGFQLLVHLKIVRTFVESILRYGLPTHYFSCIIKPEPKQPKKLLSTLTAYFQPFTPSESNKGKGKGSSTTDDALVGEFQSLMEQEVFAFILFELPALGSLEGR